MANLKIDKMLNYTISEEMGMIFIPAGDQIFYLDIFRIEGFWNERRCTLSSRKWHELNAWQTALMQVC